MTYMPKNSVESVPLPLNLVFQRGSLIKLFQTNNHQYPYLIRVVLRISIEK